MATAAPDGGEWRRGGSAAASDEAAAEQRSNDTPMNPKTGTGKSRGQIGLSR